MNILTANNKVINNLVTINDLDVNTKEYFPGIYLIYNLINQKCYVGKSINVYARMRDHILELNNKTHVNTHLKHSWNKYGEENFQFLLLEKVENESDINEREMYYIRLLESKNHSYGYNLTEGGEGSTGFAHSDESKVLLSLKAKERLKDKTNHPLYGKKHSDKAKKRMSVKKREKSPSIVQLDLDGNFVRKWNNIHEAVESLSFLTNSDRNNLYHCLTGNVYSCKGYRWALEDDYKNGDLPFTTQKRSTPVKNKIIKYDTKLNTYETFENCPDVERKSNGLFIASSVLRACKRENNKYKGFLWYFEKDFPFLK